MHLNLSQILSVFASIKINQPPLVDIKLHSPHLKNLRFLDGVALITITDASHDVAAVTMTSHAEIEGNRTITRFHLMKNRDFSDAEVRYLRDLCNLLNSCAPHRLSSSVRDLVIANCQKKILSRLIKLQKSVRDIEDLIPSWGQPNETDVEAFKKLYPTAPGLSWPQILADFLKNGLQPSRFATANSPKPLYQSRYFVKAGLLSCIPSPQLARRLKKVSDYVAIIISLTKMALRERGRRIIELNFLSSPPRALLPLIPSPLSLINESAQALQPFMDRFKIQDIKGIAPSTVKDSEIQSARQATEAFVHCECALAVEMRKTTSEPLEIGVSKDCCWPCLEFLRVYAQQSGGICLSASHGKTYQSWLFPPDVSHHLHDMMQAKAREELTSWLQALNRRRISDSHAGSSTMDDDDDELEDLERIILEMD